MKTFLLLYLAGLLATAIPAVWSWVLELQKRRRNCARLNEHYRESAEAFDAALPMPPPYTAAPDWPELGIAIMASCFWFAWGPLVCWMSLAEERRTAASLRFLFSALALVTFMACGGTHHDAPPPPPTPIPAPPAPVAAATYQARPKPQGLAMMALATVTTPTGTIQDLFLVAPDGVFRGELAGWQHLRGALYQTTDGALSVSTDATMTDPAGASVPLTLTGTLAAGRMAGAANGLAFDLEVTTLQDNPVDLATKLGDYVSTASSNGQWLRLHIKTVTDLTAEAYPTMADLQARTNRLGIFTGSISHADGDAAHLRNVFNFGLVYQDDATRTYHPSTYGLCTFTPDGGLIALTANHLNGGQLSASFAKE